MPKDLKSILIQTQDGGAIVEIKNVFLDSSQKDFSITGHIIGAFDDFQYSRFSKCDNCDEAKTCESCIDGDCWDHMTEYGNPFDSYFCEECEFENIDETKMMLLARYNFKFEALYELEKLRNAIECGAKTFKFTERLGERDLVDIALSNGIIKKEENRIILGRKKDSKPRNYTITTYEGSASIKIKGYLFEVKPEEHETNLFKGYRLKFENQNYELCFTITL